jgi:hypothetical protein
MKISLALHPRRPLNRAEAWGCFTANLALPGSGSLVAGRAVGYFQLALTAIGLLITLVTSLQCFLWFFQNWGGVAEGGGDPLESLRQIWVAVRWPLLGMLIFILSFLWALMTSLQVLYTTPANSNGAPPKA